MTAVGRKHGPSAERIIADSRAWLGPVFAAQRDVEIAALPVVEWKGRTLYTLRCCGVSGKGPHDVNVPIAALWSLVSFQRFFCPYHAGDVWSEAVPPPGSQPHGRKTEKQVSE